ncbi:hypothetical protein [Burkholderia sp. SRS-W-2-2016]|uniref:plasmid fertility inhibition factor family protein n=1 Tax=Burkholderia sp. SRS-W-2-2016 TaxID=1926878 RepID=UPI00117D854C|nr:hypothetical protein [Burkholderia sp. SRS-W-2-2016]
MQTYIGPSDSALAGTVALFKVATDRGDVLLSVDSTKRGHEERAIVEVRRDAVLGLWRNWTAAEDTGDVTLHAMPARIANRPALSGGDLLSDQTAPLPLAEVRCRVRPRSIARSINASSFVGTTTEPYVSVADGIDRMLWLTSHGARCFPVECLVAEAPLLLRLAGTPRSRWWRVSELMPRSVSV